MQNNTMDWRKTYGAKSTRASNFQRPSKVQSGSISTELRCRRRDRYALHYEREANERRPMLCASSRQSVRCQKAAIRKKNGVRGLSPDPCKTMNT